MSRLTAVLAATLVLSLGAAARAETDTTGVGFAPAEAPAAAGFGAKGQWVLTMGSGTGQHFFFHKQGSAWEFRLQPALDTFLTPLVSVGAIIRYGHVSGGAGTNASGSNAFGVGARAGANFAINGQLSVWPMAGLLLDWFSANHSSSTNTWLALWAPVLFHPAPHFFAGLGPSFQLGLTGNGANQIGIESMLGGWF